jgi:hypothetical protein
MHSFSFNHDFDLFIDLFAAYCVLLHLLSTHYFVALALLAGSEKKI